MAYKIQPIKIWQEGVEKTGNFIEARIVSDNLLNFALFYWEIYQFEKIVSNANTDEESIGDVKNVLSSGNISISGSDYDAWGSSADVNLAAYQYICSELNLTLIP